MITPRIIDNDQVWLEGDGFVIRLDISGAQELITLGKEIFLLGTKLLKEEDREQIQTDRGIATCKRLAL